jgi:hypothetical protein
MSVPVGLVICPECNASVRDLLRHRARAHTPEKDAARAEMRAKAINEQAKRKLLKQPIKCLDCGKRLLLGTIKGHYGNVHARPAPESILQMLGESSLKNRFTSDRAREAYWRALNGSPTATETEDLFDRTRVLSGGAYGLGKNRRN